MKYRLLDDVLTEVLNKPGGSRAIALLRLTDPHVCAALKYIEKLDAAWPPFESPAPQGVVITDYRRSYLCPSPMHTAEAYSSLAALFVHLLDCEEFAQAALAAVPPLEPRPSTLGPVYE